MIIDPPANIDARIVAAVLEKRTDYWSTRALVARLSAVAAGLAMLGYWAGMLPENANWADRGFNIAISLNAKTRELDWWQNIRQITSGAEAIGNAVSASISINNFVIIALVALQIIVSYRLLRGGELLRRNKK